MSIIVKKPVHRLVTIIDSRPYYGVVQERLGLLQSWNVINIDGMRVIKGEVTTVEGTGRYSYGYVEAGNIKPVRLERQSALAFLPYFEQESWQHRRRFPVECERIGQQIREFLAK